MDAKQLLRTGVCTARADRPAVDREAAGARLAAHAAILAAQARHHHAGDNTSTRRPITIAAYAGVGDEPPTRPLLDALVALGARVLLPVVIGSDTLDWAPYDGWDRLAPTGGLGLLEPTAPRLGPDAIRDADLVVVPALAVDRNGHRLGRGRGFYDRALANTARDRRVAVVYADELVEQVPTEPHDQDVGWVLTPDGLVELSGASGTGSASA